MSDLVAEVAKNQRLKVALLGYIDAQLEAAKDEMIRATTHDDLLRKQGGARVLQHMRNAIA
ncbi:MAG: hypothetical protein ACRCYS_16060 [Beijerinckiaceae bacterium]